jgi:hypothetical protein
MRPRTKKDVHLILQDELLHAINEFRRDELDLPSLSKAIDRLLRQAITARQGAAVSNRAA